MKWRVLLGLSILLLTGAPWLGVARVPFVTSNPLAIAPPPGARASGHELQPASVPASPYLQVHIKNYVTSFGAQDLYEYYLPKLQALGFQTAGQSELASSSRGNEEWDWWFTRGPAGYLSTVVLTVEPKGLGSLYSLAREDIVVPARAKASIVGGKVIRVVVSLRPAGSRPWIRRTLSSPQGWRTLFQEINALRINPNGLQGCFGVGSVGQAATVQFWTVHGSYLYSENPGCESVIGPADTPLWDQSLKVWGLIEHETGVNVPIPAG